MHPEAAARYSWRPIRWWAATATTCCCAISRARFIAIPILAARSVRVAKPSSDPVSRMRMRIGVTYDLRSDYLAMGMSEEDSAEFDSEITIASICQALSGLGHEPVRIGHIRAL